MTTDPVFAALYKNDASHLKAGYGLILNAPSGGQMRLEDIGGGNVAIGLRLSGDTANRITLSTLSGYPAVLFGDGAGTLLTAISVASLALNAPLASPTFTGTVVLPSSQIVTSAVLNTGVSGTAVDTDATMAANSDSKLASQKATKTALALKATVSSPTFTGTVTIPAGATIVGYAPLAAPTFTGHPTIEGVTSTGATGTGNLVFSAAPTFTGLVTSTGGDIEVTSTVSGATGGAFVQVGVFAGVAPLSGVGVRHAAADVTPTAALQDFSGTGSLIFGVGSLPIAITKTNGSQTIGSAGLFTAAMTSAIVVGTGIPAGATFTYVSASVGSLSANATDGTSITASFNVGTDAQIARSGVYGSPVLTVTGILTMPSPVITGHATIEGTTLTGATGTGNLVLSASPTFTGTVAGISATMVGLSNVSNAAITAAGPVGDAAHSLAVTYNAAGQLTAVTSNSIAIAASQVTSGLSGTYAPLISPTFTTPVLGAATGTSLNLSTGALTAGATTLGATTSQVSGINTQTGSYTLVAADASAFITIADASANTLTIPANSSVPFPVGTIIYFKTIGAGTTTLAITTDGLSGSTSYTAGQGGFIIKNTSTHWVAHKTF